MTTAIFIPDESQYDEIVDLWEASVRATHDFLPEEDIQTFRPLIRQQYLYQVDLYAMQNAEGRLLGFMGLSDDKLEMLFIHPDTRGQGIGRRLIEWGIREKGVRKVDVNEQNPQAVGFYKHMGFRVTHRSPVDGLGNPYPILSMELHEGN